jgi:hypothetical protein
MVNAMISAKMESLQKERNYESSCIASGISARAVNSQLAASWPRDGADLHEPV